MQMLLRASSKFLNKIIQVRSIGAMIYRCTNAQHAETKTKEELEGLMQYLRCATRTRGNKMQNRQVTIK